VPRTAAGIRKNSGQSERFGRRRVCLTRRGDGVAVGAAVVTARSCGLRPLHSRLRKRESPRIRSRARGPEFARIPARVSGSTGSAFAQRAEAMALRLARPLGPLVPAACGRSTRGSESGNPTDSEPRTGAGIRKNSGQSERFDWRRVCSTRRGDGVAVGADAGTARSRGLRPLHSRLRKRESDGFGAANSGRNSQEFRPE